jgi:probable LLM family oxidoreductase
MELGIYSFAEVSLNSPQGIAKASEQRMHELMEEIELAEQAGLDVFAIGEHHRPDYIASAPAVILGAAAARTKTIRLSSAVTVLSSDDPVRVFQQFASVDLLSGGRAEIMAGRGSFIESFPLFGYDLNDYDELFTEKLELLMAIIDHEKVNWKGKHRADISGLGVYPRPVQDKLPLWIAVGGTPASVVRAGKLGLPLALAIIGGMPERFTSLTNLYRDSYLKAGHDPDTIQLSINSQVYVADDSQRAADEFYTPYAEAMNRIGRERGWSSIGRDEYEMMRMKKGSLLVGSPEEVTDKILYEHELFGNTRFLAQMTVGPMPHQKVMKSIELFGTKVAPAVRKALAKHNPS